ncbi:glutamate-cysteine ligase family protein [Haladaptatus sp. YSMS36]|uniref:glutamate-cysteine ligase family protein n=1 Tax=Haladaptatus sp. YSMS36 TaxID=3033384 RepID=UPI0023E77DAC|nr:glutamate-cysteine ligase family protein [Haladaptatus sp. YSMS36]
MMNTGIEIEFWVVNDDGRLCNGHDLTDAHDKVEPEFVGPLIEVRTDPHETATALRRDLQDTLRKTIQYADTLEKQLVPLGTPLTDATVPAKKGRGHLFEDIYEDGVKSAKNCAGTHVHFEKGNVCRQLNLLTALDPALALVSSSPYYCGEREVDSSRAAAYRKKCGSDFERYCDLRGYADNVEAWNEQTEDAYEAFKTLAAERGVAEEDVCEHFSAENTVLNPVRLRHEQPTVEWRAPDSTLPSQAVQLAMDVRDVVTQTETKPLEIGTTGVQFDRIGVPTFEQLQSVSQQAIRWGLDSGMVCNYLEAMGFDPSAYEPISQELRGPGTLKESEARTIRRQYADRLRADVELLATPAPPRAGGDGNLMAGHTRQVADADSNV